MSTDTFPTLRIDCYIKVVMTWSSDPIDTVKYCYYDTCGQFNMPA